VLHLSDFRSAGSTSPHVYEQLPGERPKMHLGAKERHAKRQAELDQELAGAPVPPFSGEAYQPGMAARTYDTARDQDRPRYYANASMHAT
jgi:hypothetical protein